jgi:hypothetical protein
MRSVRDIAVAALGAALAAPAGTAAANKQFVVDGQKAAQWPAVAVDGKGTAHVVWQEERAEQEMVPPDHAGDAIHYCQIAERKRSCAGERTLTAPGSDAGGPRVLLTGNTVVVVTTRCCIDADDGGSVTYAFTSSDGGASFSDAMDIGANLLADAELGPGPNAVSTTWSKRACLVAKRYPKRPRPGRRPPDDQFFDLEAAAGPDGSGLIVWDRGAIFGEGPGPVRAKWFDASGPKCPKVR